MTDDPARPPTRHASSLGTWERAWQRPSRPLRGIVEGYTGYRQRMAAPAIHRGIPSPTLPLVFTFGQAPRIVSPHDAGGGVTVDAFLAGLHDRHVLIDAEEHHGIQVDLGPVAAYRLLGRPLRELTTHTVPLEQLLGPDARRLLDDLATAPDWPSRFRRLDRQLVTWLDVDARPDAGVLHAWERIATTRGRVRVADLAAEVGWSTRHLAARFGEQLGLAPKRMASLTRFAHAAELLARPTAQDLAQVAAVTGYYDQAHLTNEVRAYSGLTPRGLVAGHLPDHGGVFDLA